MKQHPKLDKNYSLKLCSLSAICKRVVFVAFLILAMVALPVITQAMDLVVSPVVTDLPNNQKRIDFIVDDGFDELVSIQFSLNWNADAFAFQAIDLSTSDFPNLGLSSFSTNANNTDNGIITFSWFDAQLTGVSLVATDVLFSVVLQQITPFDLVINISEEPTSIEVIDVNDNPINLIFNNSFSNQEMLVGTIFFDENENCVWSSTEARLANRTIIIEGNGETYYTTSNEAGIFQILLSAGNYELRPLVDPFDYWTTCQPFYSVNVATGIPLAPIEIPLQQSIDCPVMTLDIATPFLQPCSEHVYYVKYANRGTSIANNASIDIDFDSELSVLGSSIPWGSINENTYTFPLGDVAVGSSGTFQVSVNLSCDATPGQSHCTTATISPNNFCNVSPLWSQASLRVTGTCEDGEVTFNIQNVGTEDMVAPAEFIVTQDEVMHFPVPPTVELDALAAEVIKLPANGSTWRIEAQQIENHPGFSHPIVTVEGCGTNNQGEFSLGFVTPFPQDDGDLFVDVDCQENVGGFMPNEKVAFPKGYGNAHLIRANTDIEYQINFQNTGEDTVHNVVILDTLPPELNINTVRSSVSSHPFKMEVMGEGVLKFSFQNIALPSSNINQAASLGFVKYRIAQVADLPDGTLITNDASIYFDLDAPIKTNETFHTIGEDFFIINQTVEVYEPNVVVKIFPNPIYDAATISFLNMEFQSGNFVLFNQNGQFVQQVDFGGTEFVFHKSAMNAGLYFFKIFDGEKLVSTGKILVQ